MKLCPFLVTGLALGAPFAAQAQIDLAAFSDAAMVQPPQVVDCTLDTGAAAQCAQITVRYLPEGLGTGPFCPATTDDAGGLWYWTGEGKGLYRIDARFLIKLDALGYSFFDPDGTVHVTDIRLLAPSSDHDCLAASLDDTVEMVVLLPMAPMMADEPTPLGTVAKVGLALDGVPIFADAPAIQDTGHMPALDVCGGHVDPGGWYHWHATASDIDTALGAAGIQADCAVHQAPDAMFGYAFDGFAMLGSADLGGVAPVGLDDCNGHFGPTAAAPAGEYHYHATVGFPNLPPCLVGISAQQNFTTNAAQGIGSANAQAGPGPGGMPPGFNAAATALGVSIEELIAAVRTGGGRELNFGQTAAALGVTEAALRAVLPPPPN